MTKRNANQPKGPRRGFLGGLWGKAPKKGDAPSNKPGKPEKPAPGPLEGFFKKGAMCFGCLTLAGLIVGGVLLGRIGGFRPAAPEGPQVEIYSREQIDKFITSVLITVQNQPLGQANAQADMVFIASFNAFSQRLTIVALSGELVVETEGFGERALGEAYALGGPGLLLNALNQSFGLDLQSYASTDTRSLAAMIDLFGGVPLELTAEEGAYLQGALGAGAYGAGPVTLPGEAAMVHAMDGLSGGDPLGVLGRRLNLIHAAVFNLRKTATKEAMLPLLSLITGSIQTNLDFTTLHNLGYELLKAEEMEYESLALPAAGAYRETGRGLEPDIPETAALLRETLYGK